MEASPDRERGHLRVVDPQTGELSETCPNCEHLQHQLDGANVDIATWRSRYYTLKADKEEKARKNPLWPRAVRLWQVWQEVTGHGRSVFNHERFTQVEPLLKKDGEELCVRAIIGQAYDPFITTRKNGTKKKHDGWHLCFGTRDKFEEACNKAPRDWKDRARAAGFEFEEEPAADSERPDESERSPGAQQDSVSTGSTG